MQKCRHCGSEIKFRVEIWEYDSWSGPEHDSTKEFDDEKSALEYIKQVNSKNTEEKAPDFYIVAKKGW